MVGSLSAVGNIVYVAEFTHGSTNGFSMRTGRLVFHYKTGTYTPVISDGRRIYLVGYSSINALEPITPQAAGPGAGESQGEGAGAAQGTVSTEARGPPPTSAPCSRRRRGTRTGRRER